MYCLIVHYLFGTLLNIVAHFTLYRVFCEHSPLAFLVTFGCNLPFLHSCLPKGRHAIRATTSTCSWWHTYIRIYVHECSSVGFGDLNVVFIPFVHPVLVGCPGHSASSECAVISGTFPPSLWGCCCLPSKVWLSPVHVCVCVRVCVFVYVSVACDDVT